jgi:hypothetical protein
VAFEVSALADAASSPPTIFGHCRTPERRLGEPYIEDRVTMSVGLWVILAIGVYLALSLAVGLALAATLGRISHEWSDAFEAEFWASGPPRLPITSTEQVAVEEEAAVDRGHHRAPQSPHNVKEPVSSPFGSLGSDQGPPGPFGAMAETATSRQRARGVV